MEMKITPIEPEAKTFKPVKIELTVNSIKELRLLHHFFNCSNPLAALNQYAPINSNNDVAYRIQNPELWPLTAREIRRQGFEI